MNYQFLVSVLSDTDLGFDNSWYHAKTEFNNCLLLPWLKKQDYAVQTLQSKGVYSQPKNNTYYVDQHMVLHLFLTALDQAFYQILSPVTINNINIECIHK